MAASATFALRAGVWFRRGRLLIVSPDSLGTACPLSGRNSTYRPVQILGAGSDRASVGRRNRKRKSLVALLIAPPSLHQQRHPIPNRRLHHGNGGEYPNILGVPQGVFVRRPARLSTAIAAAVQMLVCRWSPAGGPLLFWGAGGGLLSDQTHPVVRFSQSLQKSLNRSGASAV